MVTAQYSSRVVATERPVQQNGPVQLRLKQQPSTPSSVILSAVQRVHAMNRQEQKENQNTKFSDKVGTMVDEVWERFSCPNRTLEICVKRILGVKKLGKFWTMAIFEVTGEYFLNTEESFWDTNPRTRGDFFCTPYKTKRNPNESFVGYFDIQRSPI